VYLIHPSAEELMDFHDGNTGNQRTYERVKAHLRDHKCPLCGGWLEALRQAQEEMAQVDDAALWQKLSPSPQATSSVLPPVSPAVTQRLSTRVPRQGEAVECHVQKGANGDLTLVLHGSPTLAGRLLEFALLAEDTGRICLSGFSVLPDEDGDLTSTVHVSREAIAARLGNTAVRAVAYSLELADLSIHDVMTLCWSVTIADKATQPAWGALCRRWKKRVPAGSLLHAWAETAELALGQGRNPLPEEIKAEKPPLVSTAIAAVVRWLREASSVALVPARVLSEGGTEEGINRESVQEIPLRSVFEESVLNERLPWAGPRLEIAKVGPPEAATAPYAAHLEPRSGEARPYGSLRLMLTAASGQSSQVQLSADCPAGVFEGDALPSDWEAVTLHLFLEEGASDA
jgi:hypothetical protein